MQHEEMLAVYLQAPVAAQILHNNFGFARARVLDTALELGVFTHIAQGVCTSSLLAALLGCDEQGLRCLLDALIGLELLQYGDAGYSLSPLARAYLVEGQPGYLGPHLRAVIEQWDAWSELTQVVRSGRKRLRQDWGSARGRGCNPGMFAHIFPLTFPIAWKVAGLFGHPLRGRVLDMFAGSGAWGIAVALRHPQVEVVARDEPALLDAVREKVRQFDLGERFTLQTPGEDRGSFTPESFRLIIIAHACRFLGACRSRELLKECYRLLQPGGTLLLVDVMRDGYTDSSAALVIRLSLFLNTREGDVFSAAQFHAWLKAAGFEQIRDERIEQVPFLFASKSGPDPL
ncbi:MAG TPA: class I SAM-dependent methyltransferase [Ktedonobacteraceae bacterium]|nr:class I SAM-dependent methyltransferase [Ktedonobacteraceae bacterium]